MANQTITADADIATVIANGLADGENITINNGAKLTVDQSPTVLIGQVTINDGELFLDGENATDPIVFVGENSEEINVNGAGIMRSSLGWWTHPTASNGSANQVWDFSSYFANSEIDHDAISGVWVETGRRLLYTGGTGVAPVVGDWVFKVADQNVHGRIVEVAGDGAAGSVVVQMLSGSIANGDAIEVHSLQENNGPDHQISWTATASANDAAEADVWQEFGNARQNATNSLNALGRGYAGLAFENAHGSNLVTFGDGVNGFIPPSGARIRIPKVHFATATLADFAAGNSSWQVGNANKYNIETVNAGELYLDGVSVGSAWFEDNLAAEFQASYCAANGNFGCYATLARTSYDHCIFVSEIEGDTRSRARSVPPVVDQVSGADIRDCLGVFINDAAETTQFGGQTSLGVNIERTIHLSTNNLNEAEFVRVNGITINDLYVIGSPLVFSTCSNGQIRLLKTQRQIDGLVGSSDQIIFTTASSQITLRGWECPSGSVPDDSKIAITDCNNLDISGFHFFDRKFDNEALGGLQGEEFVQIGGLSNDLLFSRCWTDRGNPNEFAVIAAGTSKNITVQNCSGEYTGEIEPDGINTSFRGVHGASGSLGGSNGVETDYPGTAGAAVGDCFRSDSEGLIYCRCVPGTDEYPITILAGSPKFTKDGDVDIQPGDQWEVESGYLIRGHTGFQGTIASVSAGATTNTVWNWSSYIDVELQYDDGSGFNGVWIDVTDTAAMGAIVINPAGTRFKFRFTATAAQANLQAFTLRTLTSLEVQKNNLHPLDQAPVRINVRTEAGAAVEGARVYVYRVSDRSQIISGTTDSNGEIEGLFSASEPTEVAGWVRDFSLVGDNFVAGRIAGTFTSPVGFNQTITLEVD